MISIWGGKPFANYTLLFCVVHNIRQSNKLNKDFQTTSKWAVQSKMFSTHIQLE